MKNKTIKEWLEKLPEPYRTEALDNTNGLVLYDKYDCLENALLYAFKWSFSPQGHDYWQLVHNQTSPDA